MNGARIVVCGIAGSLRAGSYNRALLRAAAELAPPELELRVFERLAEIPPYDQAVEERGAPEPVAALKAAIAAADALLVATPEYNASIPGALKNAIDWASRPMGRSVLNGKPAAILGASPSPLGTVRAQLALRQVFLSTETLVVPRPEVFVGRAHERFDAQGRLADEATRELIGKLLAALADWTGRVGRAG